MWVRRYFPIWEGSCGGKTGLLTLHSALRPKLILSRWGRAAFPFVSVAQTPGVWGLYFLQGVHATAEPDIPVNWTGKQMKDKVQLQQMSCQQVPLLPRNSARYKFLSRLGWGTLLGLPGPFCYSQSLAHLQSDCVARYGELGTVQRRPSLPLRSSHS